MRQLSSGGIWPEQQTPRRPWRRFMRLSRVSSMAGAALPMAITKTRLKSLRSMIGAPPLTETPPLSGSRRWSLEPSKRMRRSKADSMLQASKACWKIAVAVVWRDSRARSLAVMVQIFQFWKAGDLPSLGLGWDFPGRFRAAIGRGRFAWREGDP